MTVVLHWYFMLLLAGLLAWPLAFRVAGGARLSDGSYALARGLGPVLVTYLAWLMGTLGVGGPLAPVFRFSSGSVLLALAVVAVVGISTFAGDWAEFRRWWLRGGWRRVLVVEALAVAAFSAVLALRAQVPHISYFVANSDSPDFAFHDYAAEKFTDFCVLNGLLTTSRFPPEDPWLAGRGMNYYYFGHLIWASFIKLTRVRAEVGFNLALASAAGLAAALGAGLGLNLTRRIWGAALTAFLVTAAGNLDGFLQVIGIAGQALTADQAPAAGWVSLYDFWRPSRAVENTITEFPAFSHVLGDLHAHTTGLVILLTGFNLLVPMARDIRRARGLVSYQSAHWDQLFVAALLAGAMSAANSWDTVTFGAALLATVWASRVESARRADGAGLGSNGGGGPAEGFRIMPLLEAGLLSVVVVLVGARLLFIGYARHFQSPFPKLSMLAEGFGARLAVGHDPGDGFKPFAFGAGWLWPRLDIYEGPLELLPAALRTDPVEFLAHWALLGVAPAVAMWALARRRAPGAVTVAGLGLVAVAGALVAAAPGTVTLACAAAVAFGVWAVGGGARLGAQGRLLGALVTAAAALALVCELVYLDDIFDGAIARINTVFKVYYGLWALGAVATAMALARLRLGAGGRRVRGRLLAGIVVVGAAYPALAPWQRMAGASRLGVAPPGVTDPDILHAWEKPSAAPKDLAEALDGLRYLEFLHPDDLAAIDWLRQAPGGVWNAPPATLLLEAPAGQYEYAGRFAAATGRHGFAGWLMHETGWRGAGFGGERDRRTAVATEIYMTANPVRALWLLKREGIDMVTVGDAERAKFNLPAGAPVLAETKFGMIGRQVFRRGSTAIYEVGSDSGATDASVSPEASDSETTAAAGAAPVPGARLFGASGE